jgi:hypothetical protein
MDLYRLRHRPRPGPQCRDQRGIELYEGVDASGATAALDALEQLGVLVAALEDLGPVAQRAVRHHLRKTGRR